MGILLLIFNFADIFLTLLLSWDYKNDPCKVSPEQKTGKNGDAFDRFFSSDPEDHPVSSHY